MGSRRGRSNGNDTRTMNPIGQGGNVMRCVVCDSVCRLLADCPQSYENSFVAYEVELNQEEASLFTGKDFGEMLILSNEAQNCAVIDSAC